MFALTQDVHWCVVFWRVVVSDLKLRYEELLIDRGWDKDTQIQHFLEYAAEFKLDDHFLAYLGLKPTAQTRTLVSSKEYSAERLIELVVKNSRITDVIKENSLAVKDENPWTLKDMTKCIANSIAIAVDPEDVRLVQELLAYFNLRHASYIQPQQEHQTSETTKDDSGDEFFEQIYKRYATFS